METETRNNQQRDASSLKTNTTKQNKTRASKFRGSLRARLILLTRGCCCAATDFNAPRYVQFAVDARGSGGRPVTETRVDARSRRLTEKTQSPSLGASRVKVR